MNKNIIGITVRVAVILFWVTLTACNPIGNAFGKQVTAQPQPAAIASPAGGNGSVIVKDQEYDGTSIVVADAFSPGPGWMVIHNQVNGALGPPIGFTQLNPGDNKNIVIKIDPTQATSVMYAMLHQDGGTVGKYEFPGPDIPVMADGQMVSPAFNASVHSDAANITPSITVADQDVANGKVTVVSISSSGPGWVAVHVQGADGNPGPEIGYTAVKSGITQNVVVNIDAAKATPILFVMLHKDAGVLGQYEYPGPDVPQQANGQMVSPSFKTSASAASIGPTPTVEASILPTPEPGMIMGTPSGSINPLVVVSDQQLTGDSIMVDDVVSVGPGWIVIYTTNASGLPDQPIGHTAVKDGENPGILVKVDPTRAQGTLYAQLHVDSGTVGTFEYPGADAPVMVGVQMIGNTFKILSAQSPSSPATPAVLQPSITVSDQAIQDGAVTVSQVVSSGNWWLVIHKQNPDGSMGEYVGATLIKNGVNTNVVVKIDMTRATPVLYAMLHEDHGVIGQLEFPGPDVPVMVNGQMLTPQFNVTGLAEDITINIKKLSDTVSYLTDGQGISLYISLKDAPGKSNCNAACQRVWKPLVVSGKIIPGSGVNVANLGVILLADGTRQVTYLGAPLYTYNKDTNPGDTSGQGIDGVWFLVTP
jgi:predicted lipoprotein with Yx(FWY)xxD motif